MNSLYTYYNNVQKMAAYRQAKRLQRGVKLGYKQFGSGVNDTRFESAPIPIGTSDFSLELYMNSYGSNQSYPFAFNKRVYLVYAKGSIFLHNSNSYENGIYSILMEAPADGASNADSIYPSWQAPTADEKYLLTITRQGTTVKVYINGELKATKEQSEVKDLGDLQLAIANSSDVGFVRVWNMCLSADDVTAHYNNGDPMGYVVLKNLRIPQLIFPLPSYTESKNTFTSNSPGVDSNTTFDNPAENGFSGPFIRCEVISKISMFCAYRGTSPEAKSSPIRLKVEYRCNVDIYRDLALTNLILTSNEGDAKEAYINYAPNVSAYLISANNPDAYLEIRVLSIEAIGVLAEYLPQNLMFGRDDKAIATSWLDSAKQLPLSDEYMEPLFQSIGGYDMAANGVPEILYNE